MSVPRVAVSPGELLTYLSGIARIDRAKLVIDDEAGFRGSGIRDVVWSATFSEDAPTVDAARWIVWEASQVLGSPSASIHDLYMARGREEYSGFTVPALNLRTQVFDMAAAACRAAQSLDSGTVIFELARSEQEYTYQRPDEYASSVLAGAISAGWQGPVFIQGDHYQFNAAKYAADPDGLTEVLKKATLRAMAAGYGNIDIDSSTLVDLSLDTVDEQQKANYTRAAEIAALIRENEDSGLTVSIGGEIGEVGKQNSTEEELRVYLDGFRRELDARAGTGAIGLSKVSVATGTSHGGVPLPGGGVAEVKLDFGTIERLSAVCRDYGLAGAVQHGASTLPDALFNHFPKAETAEIHLATGFQNALFENEAFPADVYASIEQFCYDNLAAERKEGETDTQFIYKSRKKALGEYKRRLWDLEAKERIITDQEASMKDLFEQLGVSGNRVLVDRLVSTPSRHRPVPEGLRDVGSGV